MRLRINGNKGQRGHNVYPGSGPLKVGKTLLPARLYSMSIGVTRVYLPRDRDGYTLDRLSYECYDHVFGLSPPVYKDTGGA